MLINGKADNITREDILKVAEKAGLKKADAVRGIEEILDAISKWEDFAKEARLSEGNCQRIRKEIMNR